MENAMTFDTLQYVKRAREAGFTEKQAEFQAEEIAKIREEWSVQVATKADIKEDLQKLRVELELYILTRVGYMLTGTVAILSVLIVFLHK